ncbi:MAG: AMP-binding protein [Deltaproteobacteria bacterium]|nr:AMP-binding protein [Deltaproteobacteria bacterium]
MPKFDNPDVIITDVLAGHGKWRGPKTAITCGDRRLTWAEFDRRINQVAQGLLSLGLQKGDKVSMLMSNRLEMPEIIFGAMRAGGVIVPLSVLVMGDALARMVQDSDSHFLFVSPEGRELLEDYRGQFKKISPAGFFLVGGEAPGWRDYDVFLADASDQNPGVKLTYEDPINIMYTSGTTGTPKGILHSHHNRTHFAASFALDFKVDSGSKVIVTTSLYANGTWLMFLPVLFAGGSLVIMRKFSPPRFMELVAQERCTHTFMVPTQFQMVLEDPEFGRFDLSSMEVWLSAGSPFRSTVKRAVLEEFPGKLVELWGLTEGVATTLKPEDMAWKTESVGIPLVGWDVKIIDDAGNELPWGRSGEIAAHSAFLMPEYYKLPEKTEEAIWQDLTGKTYLRTGDMGRLDEDGYLYILDRKKDMIISGGINIYASDLEEILCQHPAVADSAVIGLPHDKWGETPMALVIARPDNQLAPEELMAWVNERLAKYQRLTKLVYYPGDFPRNALGKILKRELREELGK